MANQALFGSSRGNLPGTNTQNSAGGRAYALNPKTALAQIACTGCFNGTYYTDAETHLATAKEVATAVLEQDPEFVAKTAVYTRLKVGMKDMPAFLVVMLAGVSTELFRIVFRLVVNDGKMLRNVIQMARSGALGRKYNMRSGTWRNAIQEWFDNRSLQALFQASIGNNPPMRDILRMSRPKPRNRERQSDAEKARLLGYFVSARLSDNEVLELPSPAREYELYKRQKGPVPKVDFRFLDSLGLGKEEWTQIARDARWKMTRANLNTFARHGVFEDPQMVTMIAERLKDPQLIRQAKPFPYELLTAYKASASNTPVEIQLALQDALELATQNVPTFDGTGFVCVDVSGSMSYPITGYRQGATTVTRCVDVAALFASCVLRKNPTSGVLPFDTCVRRHSINPRDSVMTNASVLARFGGGGTDCSCALQELNKKEVVGDWVVFVSDNESWIDRRSYCRSGATGMMSEWSEFKKRNRHARLICIDLTPNTTSQVQEDPDILRVGGFSDQVFEVVASFIKNGHDVDRWVSMIESTKLSIDKIDPE